MKNSDMIRIVRAENGFIIDVGSYSGPIDFAQRHVAETAESLLEILKKIVAQDRIEGVK